MTTLDKLKNRLIDKILVTKNEEMLAAIDTIFNSTLSEETYELTPSQIEMLVRSEKDIKEGKLISGASLYEADSEWMD